MKSMTGYGSSETWHDAFTVSVEIKSLNNRYLDIHLYTPSFLNPLDQEIRDIVRLEVLRGHVDVNVRIKQQDTDVEVLIDRTAVTRLAEAYKVIAEAAGISEKPGLIHFTGNEDVIKIVRNIDIEKYRDAVLEEVKKALVPFSRSREAEGRTTGSDIIGQLEQFLAGFELVRDKAIIMENKLTETLTERFRQLVGDGYDEGRILQEVAVMLNKYTINEEIQRIGSHADQFREILEASGPIGKRLDFLSQELNREVNTIASKSIIAEVNQTVVTMKDALENIREQLRNLE